MNLTEKEYNELPLKESVDQVIANLGINMTNWYFGECTLGDNYFTVYFSNEQAEDHCLHVEFLLSDGEWILENCEITQD